MPNKGVAVRSPPPRCCARPATASASDSKELTLVDAENDVEFFYLRPRDIALYVGEGTLDVGITGRDLLLDSGAKAERGARRSASAASASASPARPGTLHRPRPSWPASASPRRTPGWCEPFLDERGIEADGHPARRRGGDQHPARRGRRDRRRRRDRQHAAPGRAWRSSARSILESEAVLVTRAGARRRPGFEVFAAPVEGVLVARSYVMMDYDIRDERVERGASR